MRRLLAKAPEARFQSAADLLWTLEQIDSPEGRAASPRVLPSSRLFNGRRGWAIAGAAGAVAGLLIVWRLKHGPDEEPVLD